MKSEEYSSTVEQTRKDVIRDILSSLEVGEKRDFEDLYQGTFSMLNNGYPEIRSIKRFIHTIKVYTEDDSGKCTKELEDYDLEDLIAILEKLEEK